MIGKEILNYRITGIIGQGGMGTVYSAVNIFIQQQQVAIKVINHDMLNDFTRQRLEQEAQRLAALNHPNIVRLINFHIDEQGSAYLIMEYAKGVSIEKYLMEVNGLVVEDRICPLFEPILDGIGYAHKHKNDRGETDPIIHCDIKPANIVITPDEEPHIKILDFGIAQIVSEQNEGNDFIMGTPSYMSPEQVKGERLDARSDIYSLGVLLHQMLTGNAPYDTTTLTMQEITDKVVNYPLPRMRTYYKYISEKLQEVVDKATAKNPGDRFQSCEEFKKALHNAVYPPKMPLWTKIAIAAVVALAIGIGTYIWDYNRIKVYYYKDYAEQWGVPQGIGELSASQHRHAQRSYKFTYQKRRLLRVSHVNSLDNLIDDGESERIERPIDQEFQYAENGNISRVKVKDRSGKVLYIKSYNDKLNVMAFQFNDEHNTERTLGKATIGYTNSMENAGENMSRISRYWLEYDENGYVLSEKYYSIYNTPAFDENHIFGRRYVRDHKGRPVEIHYIGINGEPQPTKWGLGIKKFEYDDQDNWVKATYLTTDGKSALDAKDGTAIFALKHDEYGNVTDAYYLNGDGQPMIPKMKGYSGLNFIYDENGFAIKIVALDGDRNPMYFINKDDEGNIIDGGYAIVTNEYDANGYPNKATFYDTEGNIVNTATGEAMSVVLNDEHGNTLEIWNYDKNNQLCETTFGLSGIKFEYDSVGNCIKAVYYGTDLMPTLRRDGCAGSIVAYNEMGQLAEQTNLGKDLKPAPDNNNIITVRASYDKRGNITNLSFFEADGKTPRLSNEGIAGWNNVYDERGNFVERNFFDTDGALVMSGQLGYATVKYTYDENDNQNSVRYYNANGTLTLVDGVAGYDYINDRNDNVLESKPIGTNGKLAKGHYITRYKYDTAGNQTEEAYFNNSDATTDKYGIHRYTFTYNSRNQITERKCYGSNGKLSISKDGYNLAVETRKYDEKGNMTENAFYGTDGKPVTCDEGWSSSKREYDNLGNVIKQYFYGEDGKPTDPKVMVPVGIAEYDKWGNLIYLAAQDGNGNFIMRSEKWSICRREFDNRQNLISETYFDTKEKPTLTSYGYHKFTLEYDSLNREAKKSYWGTDGKPTLHNGYHYEKKTYVGESSKLKEFSLFDARGKAVNCSAGFHKTVFTYDSLGTASTRKYYAANGDLVITERWNGNEWVTIRSWQNDARAIASTLPQQIVDGFTVSSLRITGNNSCEVTYRMTLMSRNDIDDENFEIITEIVKEFTRQIEQQLDHKPYVTGKLYDSTGKLVYTVRI